MFGKRIVGLRKSHGLTQAELAKSIGISRSALSLYEIEKREPDIETLRKFSSIFNVTVDYLLGLSDSKISDTDLEWRYPTVKNRFGEILLEYRKNENLTVSELSKKFGISEELENELESGISIPSFDLLKKMVSVMNGYTIDYLIGAVDTIHIPSEPIEIDGIKYDSATIKSNFHFKTRLEEFCIKNGISSENCEENIGLSKQDFIDIKFNRMPTISEVLRLSYSFGVSIDYLLGRTDIPLENISNDELELILNYRDCIDPYKENIRKRAYELSIETLKDISVAADEPLKKTGTTNSAK